nr:hypothetical protein [Gulosibacter sediminis]
MADVIAVACMTAVSGVHVVTGVHVVSSVCVVSLVARVIGVLHVAGVHIVRSVTRMSIVPTVTGRQLVPGVRIGARLSLLPGQFLVFVVRVIRHLVYPLASLARPPGPRILYTPVGYNRAFVSSIPDSANFLSVSEAASTVAAYGNKSSTVGNRGARRARAQPQERRR